MDLQLPSSLAEIAQCYSCDQLEDGKILIALCTTSQQLLDIVDRKIVQSIDLNEDADDIKIFTSYNPVQKYFLIEHKKQLTVIKRSTPLCIVKKYENVVKVVIQDRLRIGRPQAVIWTLIDQEPIVTDFVGHLHSTGPLQVPQLTASLSRKLQEMNLRLAKARKLLQEKQAACVNSLYQLTPHLHPPESEIKAEPKVLVWGPPFPVGGEVLQPPLRLSQPWGRTHNNKWIVGIPVLNSISEVVKDVRLRLKIDCLKEVKYETHLIVLPERQSTGAEWTELQVQVPLFEKRQDVPSDTLAVIVGVLDEIPFKRSSVVSISVILLYKHMDGNEEKSVQDVLSSSVKFKVEDLVQGKLRPFLSLENCNENDLIAVIVTSDYWPFIVSALHCLPSLTTLPLLTTQGLQEVPALQCWIGQTHGSLAGLLVTYKQLKDGQYGLDLYARDMKQVLQLVHSLSNQWKVEPRKDPAASLQGCVKNLAAELKFLRSVALPNAHFTPERWAEVRNQLSDLELKTDLSFLSYSLD